MFQLHVQYAQCDIMTKFVVNYDNKWNKLEYVNFECWEDSVLLTLFLFNATAC